MASTSGCTQQLGESKVMDPGSAMGEPSVVTEYFTACVTHIMHYASFLTAQWKSIFGGMERSVGECGERNIEEEIERSERHWSLLADPLESMGEDDGEEYEGVVAEVDNVEFFKTIQMHSDWGQFFVTFNDVGGRFESMGELVVGEKFEEGGQAELYHAQVTFKNFRVDDLPVNQRCVWVLKVFKEGTFLRSLYKQLPHGYLKFLVEDWKRYKSPKPERIPVFASNVARGILLENGRFAFLMKKLDFDLRILIERQLKRNYFGNCGPFSLDDAKYLMYSVARSVRWLHGRDIVHRDLKSSNVLVCATGLEWPIWDCVIADYECSIGVVGTGFFRAPEILQACRDEQLRQRPEVFSKAADVYSYGMICYEILTGELPFEGHGLSDYDVVLRGERPVVPKYVDHWTRAFLSRCWHANPLARPTMEDVVNSLIDHSLKISIYDEFERVYFEKLNQLS